MKINLKLSMSSLCQIFDNKTVRCISGMKLNLPGHWIKCLLKNAYLCGSIQKEGKGGKRERRFTLFFGFKWMSSWEREKKNERKKKKHKTETIQFFFFTFYLVNQFYKWKKNIPTWKILDQHAKANSNKF